MNVKELRYIKYLANLTKMKEQKNYWKLFQCLYSIDYRAIIRNDENRGVDGLDLRDHYDYYFPDASCSIVELLADKPCSVLEMMVALCNRMEQGFLYDAYDDWIPMIFMQMLSNLGLEHITDDNYDPDYIAEVIERWLNREFEYDGSGSLFRLDNPPEDIRNVETWMAMSWFINENYI